MEPGKLRHRVNLQRRTTTQSATGQPTVAWTTYAARWASVRPLQGREFMLAKQVAADVTTEIKLRYLGGVTAEDRVLFGSRIYDINTVINTDERNVELVLMCKEAR